MTPFPRTDYESLAKYEPGRRPAEVDLSDNTNLWGPHPDALARIRAATPDDVRCYPEVYADTLRAAVAEKFGVSVDCVTTGAGSDDILDSAFRAAAGPGAAVSFAAPTFVMAKELAQMNGMRPRPVPWADAMRDPRSLLHGGPAVVYLCRPNNPTGAHAPESWMQRLLDLAGDSGPLVVLDEAYADFAGESLVRWAVERPRLLVVRTCSKAYGLAGLRCGFAVAQPAVALEVEKSRGPYKVSRLTVETAAAAVRDASGWMSGVVSECLANRRRLYDELIERGIEALASRANFILFAAPSGSAADDTNALRDEGVQVRPFRDIPELGDALRVTVGPWPLLERFLAALDRRLAALPASPVGDRSP
jgi:histidinol-phosphate aminotransferase